MKKFIFSYVIAKIFFCGFTLIYFLRYTLSILNVMGIILNKWKGWVLYMVNVKSIIIIAVSVVILCGGIYGIKYMLDFKKYKETINGIKIENVDLSKVKDGNYTGNFDAIFIGAEVNVKVENHKILDIELVKHKNERGKKAEVIPERVVQAQSLQVDTVSGATNSSKVILRAIENALNWENIGKYI